MHKAQLMPLPLTVSCFSKSQIGFTLPVPAHLGSPGKGPFNGCVWGGIVWRGYLSGARCRLAYGPADAAATQSIRI